MRYFALATDYDGTIAHNGRVAGRTLDSLIRLRESGRKLLLVTGREMPDLMATFSELSAFDLVVAENGAMLYYPETQKSRVLCAPPIPEFVEELRRRGVKEMSVGESIVATWEPYETAVLESIRDLGLELQVIFNKGAVMVLPAGVNKATGLQIALQELKLSPHSVVGVGDAENDHSFLSLCEFSVAVSNAIPSLQERCDLVTAADHGDGVSELVEQILADDLAQFRDRLLRHRVLLGKGGPTEEEDVMLDPYGPSMLIAGSSGSGKSSLATGLLERLGKTGYQYCVIDPEGDYSTLEGAVALGSSQQPPNLDEVHKLLEEPQQNVVVNLAAVRFADRPGFFLNLLNKLQSLRAATGRPHWILVDEAHHVLPSGHDASVPTLPERMPQVAFITVEPQTVAPAALTSVDILIGVGTGLETTLGQFCQIIQEPCPDVRDITLESGEVLTWFVRRGEKPFRMRVVPGETERRRHNRKYAEGNLEESRSFFFRGPEDRLKLRAQNLITFLQLAEGVDEETWLHHLQQGDYSRWFREAIKDANLADEAEQVEQVTGISAEESRKRIRELVEQKYTLPAEGVEG